MHSVFRAVLYHLAFAALGIAVGLAAGAVCGVFGAGVAFLSDTAQENFALNVWFLPLAGLLTAVFFRLLGSRAGGMDRVFRAARGEEPCVPLASVAYQFAGAWSAHLFAASVGREGAGVQIGAAVGNVIGRNIPLRGAGRILTAAGMAAGFSALFMTPVSAFFFALEVTVVGRLDLRALIPCFFASFAACFAAGCAGAGAHTYFLTAVPAFDWLLLAKVAAMGALFGLAGLFFTEVSRCARAFFSHSGHDPFLRAAAAGVLLACLLYLTGGRYAGLGTNLISGAFSGEKIYIYDWAVKILFTAATLGAGFIGGEVTTMFAAGAALGAVLGDLFGLPREFAVCLGYAAVFGSATNTLIAPVFLGGEIFGFAAAPYLFVACAAAYVFNFGRSVYAQKAAPRPFSLPARPRRSGKRPLALPHKLY